VKNPKDMRFLIIDDIPNMVRTIRNMLCHLGYHCTIEAEDGESAWNILNANDIYFVSSVTL